MPERPALWLVRHGQTAWSADGRHTSRTDLPLTATGEQESLAVRPLLASQDFALVESSPRQRALRTAQLAGFQPAVDEDLAEWDYGELEGLTAEEITSRYPGWTIWEGPWPGGERPEEVAARAERVAGRVLALPAGGKALVFAHGHILRALAACWLGRPIVDGRLFALGTATVSTLGWEHDQPAVHHWNVPPGFSGARPAPGAPAVG